MRGTDKATGFTLIELMITLIVAALLLVWGIPSFQKFIQRTTLTSKTNDWVGVLNSARSEAVTRGRRVTICRSTDMTCNGSGTCPCGGAATYRDGILVFASDPGGGAPTQFNGGTDALIKAYSFLDNKVAFFANAAADAGGNGTLSFLPDGSLENGGTPSARYVLCALATAGKDSSAMNTSSVPGRAVILNSTGRPTVQQLTAGKTCDATAADDL